MLTALPGVNQEEVGGDGAALRVLGGAPGGAIGVVDGDEVDVAERAYVLHPDVGLGEAVAAGLAGECEGFRDIRWRRAGGNDSRFGRDAVDGDLDALDSRLGEAVEHEVKALGGGAGLSGVAGAHDLSGGLTAGVETYGAACVVRVGCVERDRGRRPFGGR